MKIALIDRVGKGLQRCLEVKQKLRGLSIMFVQEKNVGIVVHELRLWIRSKHGNDERLDGCLDIGGIRVGANFACGETGIQNIVSNLTYMTMEGGGENDGFGYDVDKVSAVLDRWNSQSKRLDLE